MRILYATDGSGGAGDAGRFLAAFAHRRDVHVHILTLLGDEEDSDGSANLKAARAALDGFPGHVTTGIGRTLCGRSEIVELICLSAEEIDADLIVVGSRGLSSLARFLLGSVAEGVVRYAPCSVLLARPLRGNNFNRVLVGIDGSDRSVPIAEWLGAHLPPPAGCQVQVAGIVPPARDIADIAPNLPFLKLSERLGQAAEAERSHLEGVLQDLAPRLEGHGWNVSRHLHASLSPADALLEIAEAGKADLVVVGARGQSRLDRVLLGSVSESVARHAPCSVLVVRDHAAAARSAKHLPADHATSA